MAYYPRKTGGIEAIEANLLRDQASRAGRILRDAASRLEGRDISEQTADIRALFDPAIQAASKIETLTE